MGISSFQLCKNYTSPQIYSWEFLSLTSYKHLRSASFWYHSWINWARNSFVRRCSVRRDWTSCLIKLQAKICNFIKQGTLALVLSCEFWEISKNSFSKKNFSGGCVCWVKGTRSTINFDTLLLLLLTLVLNSNWQAINVYMKYHQNKNGQNISCEYLAINPFIPNAPFSTPVKNTFCLE